MTEYQFEITYLSDNGQLLTHKETKKFATESQGYDHFADLCDLYRVGGYYYLCEWKAI